MLRGGFILVGGRPLWWLFVTLVLVANRWMTSSRHCPYKTAQIQVRPKSVSVYSAVEGGDEGERESGCVI